jgi:hypothetical protein
MSEADTCEQCTFYITPAENLLRGTCTFHRKYNTDPQYPPRGSPACRFFQAGERKTMSKAGYDGEQCEGSGPPNGQKRRARAQ